MENEKEQAQGIDQQDNSQNSVPLPEKNNRPFSRGKIFFLASISLILISSFLWYSTSRFMSKSPSSSPSPTPSVGSEKSAPSVSAQPSIPGWKTYRNQAGKFSLSYPGNYLTKEQSYGMGVASIELSPELNAYTMDQPSFQLLVFPKSIGKMINQDFDTLYSMTDNSTKDIKDPKGNGQKFTKIKNRTVSGQKAFDFKTEPIPADKDYEPGIGVYIDAGDNSVVISTGESGRSTLETILGTFRYPL